MSLTSMNRTGLDADREERVANGTAEPTAEEALQRDWEVEDALAGKAVELGITGPWTSFSPAECSLLVVTLEAAVTATEASGAPFSDEACAVIEALRLKALAGAAR